MGCLYCNFDGECELYSNDNGPSGQVDGVCVVDEDPNPADSCEFYESNWTCPDCGVDLNVEECKCDKDNEQ